jgi:hypothetical protein
MDLWNILGIIAIICLLASFSIGKNAIWGTLTVGAILGLIVCLIIGFKWELYKKILIVSVFVGVVFEVVGRLANHLAKKRNAL